MKKLALTMLALCQISAAFAGGILTNTNQSARFARLMALEASTNADAAYYNPAGTIKLPEGFHFTFSNQSAFQKRIINSTFAPMTGAGSKEFVGTASAPIIPSLQGVYRKGKWALSGSVAVTGGGGKATFNDGLPSFESAISVIPSVVNAMAPATNTTRYSVDAYMRGSSFIYGAQLGGTYAINDMFSAYGGFRLNIVNNSYEGYLKNIKINPTYPGNPSGDMILASDFFTAMGQTQYVGLVADREIDNKQSGWGVAPVLGVHFNYKKLNIGMKYEFKTRLDVESKTVDGKDAGLEQFKNGVNTPHDIPALFTVGVSYDILPQLTASVGYHHFFDKDAEMANDKQKHLSGGTNEYLAGIEYRIDDMFLVSMGGQITRYGLGDGFQSDLSFSVNSYSLGFGGAVNVSKNVQINIGYFFTDYSDYTKKTSDYSGMGQMIGQDIPGQDVFTRKNKVFTAGVDFSF